MISQGLKTEGRATGLVAVRVADVLTRNGEDDVTEARSVCEKKNCLGLANTGCFAFSVFQRSRSQIP